jgi:hypothetical protein
MSGAMPLLSLFTFMACTAATLPFLAHLLISHILYTYRGAGKSLDRPTSLSIVFSVQETCGSPTGPDPENRVGD